MNYIELANEISARTERKVPVNVALKALQTLQAMGVELVHQRHQVEITEQISEHPEGYEGVCNCDLCRSYA